MLSNSLEANPCPENEKKNMFAVDEDIKKVSQGCQENFSASMKFQQENKR